MPTKRFTRCLLALTLLTILPVLTAEAQLSVRVAPLEEVLVSPSGARRRKSCPSTTA